MLVAAAMLWAVAGPLGARTKQGDTLLAAASKAEQRKDWDKALELYEKALARDPGDVSYQMGVRRVRFQAAQAHVNLGQKLREKGLLDEALAEFQKAYAMDPSSAIAEQELKRTLEMIERNKKAGAGLTPSERGLTPAELTRKEALDRIARIEGPPELKPLSRQPISLRMANQPPKVLFETVGKVAGINVVFDPDYRGDPNAQRAASIELNNSTLEDALDYLAMMTKSFWKPLSSNAIFVTNDNPSKHRDYDDSVVRVFYLTNLTTPQELAEITTAFRTVANARKVYQYNSLNAVIIRGTPDEVMLAEKLVNDLDKPKSEVVVDVIVMEASKNKTRNLAATIASNGAAGIDAPIQFTPRNPVLLGGSTSTSSSSTTTDTTQTTLNTILSAIQNLTTGGLSSLTSAAATSSSTTQQLMSLARIAKISTNDFSITMPGALLQAVMSDSNTKILQSPQVRAASGQKATLRIGDRVPIASGGMQPMGGTIGGYSSLYSSFQYLDVGVNVDITPTVHGEKEVTLKAVLEISSVTDHVNIGGISQPVIGQRKVEHEIRIREGEVSLLGGLMQDQNTKSIAGIPGLMNIPGVGRFFQSSNVTKSNSELLIALIPHIVRTQGITDLNLRSISVGNDTVTRLSYAPRQEPAGAAPEAPRPAVVNPAMLPAPAQPPAVVAPAPAPAEAPTRLILRPSLTQVQVGTPITIQLEIENAKDLFAAPFHLKFDPQVLRLTEVKAGGLLSSDGQKIIFTRNILNESGDATVNLNRMPGTSGIGGSGVLATFTFQAVKPGATVVTFSELTARNSQLQPIQAAIPQTSLVIK
ncbi:MAG: cohesin domain-containing protein [Bryobacteraceae bacterium]|jgi:general secretion pathway protein D